MPTRVIMFNGPPYCGKDAGASAVQNFLHKSFGGSQLFLRMSLPLKRAGTAILGEELNCYGGSILDNDKESIIHDLGVSWRQFQIDLSEKFMKAQYGNDIFVRLFIREINSFNIHDSIETIVLCPDCGFDVEVEGLSRRYGRENILVVHVLRDGCTFENDSRNYTIDAPATHITISNNGTLEEYERKCILVATDWLFRKALSHADAYNTGTQDRIPWKG